ncbi:microtubule-associated protein futsch isoform X2 [Cephus cinctus]|uniref:Microtubule-associated protein futsch isoform X2 n=1 Tax=Cephus cinctus TaxID=211228 RepID=A0AAJ7BZT9_CEPCN|nr:microtubule-associated protein futsch isoform X2 [Cephus cinctus]
MSIRSHSLGARGVSMNVDTSWAAQGLASAITNLNSMARFQQKQLQEKEQKLLQLYDQQQQRAYQVVQRGSAGSTGSNHSSSVSHQTISRTTTTTHSSSTSQGGGKVRQMFDERRQTTVKGIDRSYPLEPLDNKPKKQVTSNGHAPGKGSNAAVNHHSVTVRRVARADVNSNVNGGKPVVSYHEEVTHESFGDDDEFGNENHDKRYTNGNHHNANRNEVHIEEILDDDTIQRNRLMAKVHLMNFDKTMKYRIDNDLESEQFPEELMLDVPDKLPKRAPTRKISQAEARLERFKNANARKSNVSNSTTTTGTVTRKRSEPMFPAGTSSREPLASTRITKTVNTMKTGRSEGPTRKRNEGTRPEVISKNAKPTKAHSESPKISQDTKAGTRITLRTENIFDSPKKDDATLYEPRTVQRQCRRSDTAGVQSGYREFTRTGFNEREVKIVGKPTSFAVEKTESRTVSDGKIVGSVKVDGTGSVEIIEKKRKPGFSKITVIRKSDKVNEGKRSYARDINSTRIKSKHEIDTARNVKSKIISSSPEVVGAISKNIISRESSRHTAKSLYKGRTVQAVDKSYTRMEKSSSGRATTPESAKRRVSKDSITRMKTNTGRRDSVERSNDLKSDIMVRSAQLVKKVMRRQSIEKKSDIIERTALKDLTKKSEKSISPSEKTELRKTLISENAKKKIDRDSRKQIRYHKEDITPVESVTKGRDSIEINTTEGDIDKFVVSNKIRDSRQDQNLNQSRGTPRFSQKKLKHVGSGHDPKEIVDDVRIERIEEKKDVMSDGRRSKGSITRVDMKVKTHQSLGRERQLSEMEGTSRSKARIKKSRSPSVEERKPVPIEISKKISKKSPVHSTEKISKDTLTQLESERNRSSSVDADSTRSRINKTMKTRKTQKSTDVKKSRESSVELEIERNLKNKKTTAVISPRERNNVHENIQIRPTSPVRRLCRDSTMKITINLKQSGSVAKDKKVIPKSPGKSKPSSKSKSLIPHSERNEDIKTRGESSAKQLLDKIDSPIKSREVSDIARFRKSKVTVESSSSIKCDGTGKLLRSIELVRKVARNQSPGISRKLEEGIITKSGSLKSSGLESEEVKKSGKPTDESARMKSNESTKIKVSSDEESPKSSILSEIDTDRQEILVEDQSIKRDKSSVSKRSTDALSSTSNKGMQSMVKAKETQSKTASPSKAVEVESDNMTTQSAQDHSTFLIRRPIKKRGTVLNSDIYEQQEASQSKHAYYTGTGKIDRNSNHDKISKYDKANASKIQIKDISKRGKSPDLKRSGRDESKVTVSLPVPVELEKSFISAELARRTMDDRRQENTYGSRGNGKSNVLKEVHIDETELTPEYQEISITDQFIEPGGNRLKKRKEDALYKKTEQKRQKTIEDVERDSVDPTKKSTRIVSKPKVVGTRRRICSKLIRQMETNLKEQPAKKAMSYKKIVMTKERSNIRKSPAARSKSPKVETSERPSSRLSGTVEFDSIKKQPVAMPRTVPTKSPETTRGKEFVRIPSESTDKQEILKSPQLMQKVIREQSPEHKSMSSESINFDREISEFETVPIIISKEPEQPEHKIVRKQEAMFSPSKNPESMSKPTRSAVSISKKVAEKESQKQKTDSVSRICLKLAADKEFNAIREKSIGASSKRPTEVKVSRSIKATIRKPVQRPRRVNDMPKVDRLTDVPANGRASSARQIATVSRKHTVKSVGKNLPTHSRTRNVSKDSLSPKDSKLKLAPSTKALRSTALVQSAMKKQTSGVTKINTSRRDTTKSVESLENVKNIGDKIPERPIANVGLKRKSRPPNLNLEIIRKSKRVDSAATEKPIERTRTDATNKKVSGTVKTYKVEEVERSKKIEPEVQSSSRLRIVDSDEQSFQNKLIDALTKTINEKKTPYIVSSPDPSRIERLYPRYPVEEEVLSSPDIMRRSGEIKNNVPPVKCESTDSVESALRRFDSIGTDTDQQEIVQVDTADNHMIDIRVAQGLMPKPESPKARMAVKNDTTDTDQSESVTVIKGHAKPVGASSNDRLSMTTRKVEEKNIPEIVRVDDKKYLSEVQPIRKNISDEKKEKANSIINLKLIEKTPESGIGKISIAALDTPLQDFESKQRKIARARNSVELARTSVQIQKPSWRRKLFEDSDSGVETEVVRPRTVNFHENQRIDKNLKSTNVIKGKSEILECANRISKIPVSRAGFKTHQLQSATPLRSIEVIRKSIRKEQQGQLRKTIPEEPDFKKESLRKPKSVTIETGRKMTKPIISKIAQNNRDTVKRVLKASITRMASKPKNSQTIGLKSNHDKDVTTKGSTTSQKSHCKNTKKKVETKFQREKPSSVFFEYSSSLTREGNANHEAKSSVKPPKSKEAKQSIEVEEILNKNNRKLSHQDLQVENSVNPSPREKDLHELKRKQTKPISTRRSTAPLFLHGDKKFKITNSTEPNVTRRQSTGSNLKTVNDKSNLADSLSKETLKSNYFIKKDKNQDATKTKILKNVTDEYRSDSLDSLDAEYKHKESSDARYETTHTQSSDNVKSSKSACRISQSTFAVDSRSESPDSLEAARIYSRQTIRDESFTGQERNTDRDQSPSPDSLDEACKYYTNTRNKYRTDNKNQARFAVESRTESEDSLESASKHSKSIKIQKIFREFTESPESNDKGQSIREFHEITIPHEQYLKRQGNNSKALKQQETLTKSPAPALRVSKAPSPDPVLRKGVDSNSRTPAVSAKRSVPQSPTKNPEVAARVSAEVKNSVARATRKSSSTARSLDTSGNKRATPNVPKTGDNVDAPNRENNYQSENSAGERKLDGDALPLNPRKSEAFTLEFDAFGESTENGPTAARKPPARKQVPEKLSGTPTQRSPAATPYTRPVSSLSTASSSSSARGQTSAIAKGKMATKSKSKSPTRGRASSGPKASARSGGTAVNNDNLIECKICGRRFAQDRIGLHEQICAKTGQKKRKQFDAMLFRVKGTDLEPFARKGTSKKTDSKNKKPEVKSNWRKKHEDFINAIRSAKQVQAHLAAGGKLSDLPPPPVSDTSDYIQCPHCGRKFNQSAAERHIPKCETMLHNKPNPRAPPKPKR